MNYRFDVIISRPLMIDVSVFFLYNASLQYLNVNVYITWKNTKYDDLSKEMCYQV